MCRGRLLSDPERRDAQDTLAKRQAEVVAQVQGSQVSGEVGRQMMNEAQRELLEIGRVRSKLSKRHVLVRTDSDAASAASDLADDEGYIAGIPAEQIGVIDELNEEEAEVEEDVDEEEAKWDNEDVARARRAKEELYEEWKLSEQRKQERRAEEAAMIQAAIQAREGGRPAGPEGEGQAARPVPAAPQQA